MNILVGDRNSNCDDGYFSLNLLKVPILDLPGSQNLIPMPFHKKWGVTVLLQRMTVTIFLLMR